MTSAADVGALAQVAIDEAVAPLNAQLEADEVTISGLIEDIDALRVTVGERDLTIADLQAQLADCRATSGAARFPGDPGLALGDLFIGESRQGGNPADRETYIGHNVAIFRSYVTNGSIASADDTIKTAARDKSKGRYPLCSTKVPGGDWAGVADGAYDDWLHHLLDGLVALDWPVGICFHHEPVDNQSATNTPATHKAMHRRARAYVDGKPGNKVAVIPILQSSPFSPSVGGNADVTKWIDPDCCHLAGLDGYNHKSFKPDNGSKWRTPQEVFEVAPMLTGAYPDLPVIIAETNVRTDPNQPGRAAGWMRDAIAYLRSLEAVVAVSFFDSGINVNDGGSSWQLHVDGPERLDAFKQLILTESVFL